MVGDADGASDGTALSVSDRRKRCRFIRGQRRARPADAPESRRSVARVQVVGKISGARGGDSQGRFPFRPALGPHFFKGRREYEPPPGGKYGNWVYCGNRSPTTIGDNDCFRLIWGLPARCRLKFDQPCPNYRLLRRQDYVCESGIRARGVSFCHSLGSRMQR